MEGLWWFTTIHMCLTLCKMIIPLISIDHIIWGFHCTSLHCITVCTVHIYIHTGLYTYRVIYVQGYIRTGLYMYRVIYVQGYIHTGLYLYRVIYVQGYIICEEQFPCKCPSICTICSTRVIHRNCKICTCHVHMYTYIHYDTPRRHAADL